MKRYSIFSLLSNAISGHQDWPRLWRDPDPKPAYDVVIVGGGGHGLATAYYLAKEHGITNVAVLEKGWLGGGNTGRNTTIIRSNYLWDDSAALYEHSLKLWEGLTAELNFNVMFSQRGVLNLGAHAARRARGHAAGQRQPSQRHRRRVADARPASRPSARSSTPIPARAIRCWGRRCSGAAASRGTMPSPGASPAPPMRAASTSSRTAR